MTRADRVSIAYRIRFLAPFHLGTGLRRGLVHRGVTRDPEGFLFVPGSTIKGVARERCEQLASLFLLPAREPHAESADLTDFGPGLGIVEDIFGARTRPGTVFFDDAHLIEDDRRMFEAEGKSQAAQAKFREFQVAPRTRVHLSRLTMAAKTGHLFASEYGLREMQFEGNVSGVLVGNQIEGAEVTYQLVVLISSLLAIDALGGEKSCGAGACSVEIASLLVNGGPAKVDDVLDQLVEVEYYELAKE